MGCSKGLGLRSGILLLTASTLACQTPPRTPEVPHTGDVCENLAYVFYLVGRNKDKKITRREQLAMAEEGIANPFASQPGRTLRYWEQVIDYVYRERHADADEIRSLALERCHVNERGQAVLLWPRE